MRITAVTRFKHGTLFALLRSVQWTQQELARQARVSPNLVSRIINLRTRPSQAVANAIQRAFAKRSVYLDVLEAWPATFKGIPAALKFEQTRDVEFVGLEAAKDLRALEADYDGAALTEALGIASGTLTGREQAVIDSRFMAEHTLNRTGKALQLTAGTVGQIERKALRKLHHPARMKILREWQR